jgi:hypothetical protein
MCLAWCVHVSANGSSIVYVESVYLHSSRIVSSYCVTTENVSCSGVWSRGAHYIVWLSHIYIFPQADSAWATRRPVATTMVFMLALTPRQTPYCSGLSAARTESQEACKLPLAHSRSACCFSSFRWVGHNYEHLYLCYKHTRGHTYFDQM